MPRLSTVFALLCACSAGPTTPPPTAVQESEGAEVEVSEEGMRAFVAAVESQIYTFEALDEHERWQRQEEDRRAYGNDEDCEGVCGLSVPESEEPPLPDPDELAEQFDELAAAIQSWEHPPWSTAMASIREARAAARAEGDPTARARAAANQMEETLRAVVLEGVVAEPSCWLGMRLVALDSERLDAALLQASTAATLRRQVSYAMDEGGGERDEEHESLMDELDEAMERSEGIVDRGRTLLSDPESLETFMVGAPESFETVMAELHSLQRLVTPYLSERIVADFETQRDALRRVCRP